MDLQGDIRAMIAASDTGSGDALTCSIAGAAAVSCLASFATQQDALNLGDTVTIGKTRVLRIARADAPGMATGTKITWNSQNWTVIQTSSAGHGELTRAFLGVFR